MDSLKEMADSLLTVKKQIPTVKGQTSSVETEEDDGQKNRQWSLCDVKLWSE
jgi:hypothetical protein